MNQIPVMKPILPKLSDVRLLLESIDHNQIYSNNGPLVKTLEIEYAEYLKASPKCVVSIANATLAILGCLTLTKKTNCFVPDYTFAASALAATQGCKDIILVDVNKLTFKMNLNLVKEYSQVNKQEYTVLPVLPFGAPVDLEQYNSFDSVVIDAAASMGASIPDFRKMKPGWFVVYSLHATKIMGCGEGAIVVCGSEETAKKLKMWSNFGFDGTRVPQLLGLNSKMSEISAAYALVSLRKRETEFMEWQIPLSKIKELNLPEEYRTVVDSYPGIRPYWIITCESSDHKNKLILEFKKRDIETRSWWPCALSEMSVFSSFKSISETGKFKVSNELASTHLGLPVWRGIKESDLNYISEILNEFNPY